MKLPLVSAVAFLTLLSCTPTNRDEVPSPRTHADGSPFRVAVVQSGDYYYYNAVLSSIHAGLADLGWLTPGAPDTGSPRSIPDLLKEWKHGKASLEFLPELYLDLQFTESRVPPASFLALVGGTRGADAVLCLGTVAGLLASEAAREGLVKVPVLIESVSDPVGSGIITSVADSGHELLSATFDPSQYERQVRLFHRIVGFHRLGMIYTDSETGRAYAALDTVSRVGKERGFQIVPETGVLEDPPDESLLASAENAYVDAFDRLARRGVDAVYLTIQAGLTEHSLPAVQALALKYRLPTFAMEGADFVRLGALAGESHNVLVFEGLFSAGKLVRLVTGQPPRSLPQTFEHNPHIALNLATARAIGFTIPADVLLDADEVYNP